MSTEADTIAAEVADLLAKREAEKAEAARRIAEGPAGSMSDFVAELRRQWIEAGIIAADAPPVAQDAKTEAAPYDPSALARKSRLGQFRGICPDEFFAKIDETKIPNLKAWHEADAWTGSHPGLWLWSPETGRAKTRMLWRQFGRLFVERNRRCIKITGQALAEEYFSYHMDGDPTGFYRWILGHDVVMLDDLDKMDLSDKRAPRMCRELFDKAYESHKPLLVTANEPIAHFQQRLGDSTSRRMAAVCREIRF